MIAFAPSPARPDALLTPATPGHAYAADVARLNGREPVGPADDAWLALAHAVTRAAALSPAQRPAVLAAGANSLAALLPDDLAPAARRTLAAAAGGLHTFAARLGRWRAADRTSASCAADAHTTADALAAVQQAIAEQEQAGAFLLAFSTLAALRVAVAPVLDARGQGLLLAQQGRVARQLGALTTAAELYHAADRSARAARAPDVAARALLGAGSLATVRGNYPEARTLYQRALRAAARAGDAELERAGHHGLLIAAFAANDVDTALAHGWAAVRGFSDKDAEARAEVLANLGEVGRQAGEHRAALGACLSALELTHLSRVRLPALGTAVLAAAQLGEHKLLTFLARDVNRAVARSGQPYENARALMNLAEAYSLVGEPMSATYASAAGSLAETGRFHEIAARAEQVLSRTDAEAHPAPKTSKPSDRVTITDSTDRDPAGTSVWSETAPRTPRARAVLRSLEALTPARRYAAVLA